MNVIVDVSRMNVNMRVSEDPIEGISLQVFRAKGAAFIASLGQRPRNPIAPK
jgi:hypothetical protein